MVVSVSRNEKKSIIGTLVAAADYHSATEMVIDHARAARPFALAAEATHGITLGWLDRSFGSALNGCDLVVPDGQPVRWALNWIHGAGLTDRVYGPNLMLHVCRRAAEEGLGIFLYGSTDAVLEKLRANLTRLFPGLILSGALSPPFRALSPEEDENQVQQILESRARIVFVGLGCPKQERWVQSHRERVGVPLLALGAAFDFHAGNKPQAPAWMQRRGLEWLFRLVTEPRRLWWRYALFNPLYILLVSLQAIGARFPPHPRPAAASSRDE